MSRRTIVIASALVVILLSGGATWYLYSGGGRSLFGRADLTLAPRESAGEVAPSEALPLIAISSERAYFPALSGDGRKVYYLSADGSLRSNAIHSQGSQRISLSEIPGAILKVRWSPGAERAVLWSEVGEQIKVHMVEITGGKTRELFPDISEVAFAPDGKSFAALGHDDTQTFIQRFRADGTNPQTLLALARVDLALYWAEDQRILLWERPSENAPSSLFRFDLRSRALTLISQGRLAANPIVSPPGGRLLISSVDIKNELEELALLDLSGIEVARLPASTLASKCIFAHDGNTLLCAIAEILPLPGQFWASAWRGEGRDRLVRFDLTGKLKPLEISQELVLNITEPLLSKDGRYLIFIDPKDGRLLSLALP